MDERFIDTRLVGDYNLPNVLAAVTIGKFFNVSDHLIRKAISDYEPSNSRSQLLKKNSNTIILDAYNANPSSMKLAIENFSRHPAKKKVLVLGAMAELGEDSIAEHESIVQLIGHHPWTAVVLVGGDFQELHHPYLQFENALEAANWYREQDFRDTHILIKGSRSMKMENVLN
jgi:UDP-N-acetylmuramoyl-tripeptide--D-alanyl-D-alanine ligase